MSVTPLLIAALLLQGSSEDPPFLVRGETLSGAITDADPVVHAPRLVANRLAPVVGQTFLIEVEKPGPYTIELRSWYFDAYLVLRDESEAVLAEDDDGLLNTHSRILCSLAPGRTYLLQACALHGGRGQFELCLQAGEPRVLSERERVEAELGERSEQIRVLEKALPESRELATALDRAGQAQQQAGDYHAARANLERALAIREKVLGPDHRDVILTMQRLGSLLQVLQEFQAARLLLERALAISERTRGPEHRDTAAGLNNLGTLLLDQGDHVGARPFFERALAIQEKVLGPEHLDTLTSIANLGTVLKREGDHAAARQQLERAVAIAERSQGPESPITARCLTLLGSLLLDQGDYAAARMVFERTLAIRMRVYGPEHVLTAETAASLGILLGMLGDRDAARAQLEDCLGILEQAYGADNIRIVQVLDALGNVLKQQGAFATARSLLERALAIVERELGPEHESMAERLNSLAAVFAEAGDGASARPLLERALAIQERVGLESPALATSLNLLAYVLSLEGKLGQARSFEERALGAWQRTGFKQGHIEPMLHHNLGVTLADLGSGTEAARESFAALSLILQHARGLLWSLSEPERLALLAYGHRHMQLALSASSWPSAEGMEPEAYELSLAWRGLASRSLLASRDQLRRSVDEAAPAVLTELQRVQSKLSSRLSDKGAGDPAAREAEIGSLRTRRNELEVELQRLSGPSTERVVTLAELRANLAVGTAFLDFLVHPLYVPAELDGARVVRAGKWRAEHVTAWIVRPDRELVRIDLGPATSIEAAVKGWLGEIVSNRGLAASEPAEEHGARLRELLWTPLAASLAGVERVFVRPDSFLGTLPFGVLPLEGDRFLIEERDFVYVQTPLDLVQREERTSTEPRSLLTVGGVNFQERAPTQEPPGGLVVADSTRVDELRGSRPFWGRLPSTEYEAQVVHDLFRSSFEGAEALLLGAEQATEERIKQELPRHSFLHLATHGYFHPEGTVSMWEGATASVMGARGIGGVCALSAADARVETRALVGRFPGLLTGLVWAGANVPAAEGRDDGLLTAEEVLWLDLSRVELVVLSACETALGERRSGEGMIGLQRAFGLAGARTVISSLWSVKDSSTAALMQSFYAHLWLEKEGRAGALRRAQLELLANNRATQHAALPSTWGAFVLSGDWR